MFVISVVLGIIVLILPFFVGSVFDSKSVGFTYLFGQISMWALFQIIAVPMVYFRANFSLLFWVYTAAMILLIAWAIWLYRKKDFHKPFEIKTGVTRFFRDFRKKENLLFSIILIAALLVIAYQCCVYIFGMHLDEDDARWIAEANDALVKNKMLLHNPATGEYIGRFVGEMVKDVFSPWAFYIAWMSRLTAIKAVVIAHTVYPPVLLILSYCAYWEIGKQLFKGKQERAIFLLMVSVINLFFAGNPYTQSVFSLTRIWQGKAVIAAVIIPSLFLVCLMLWNSNKKAVHAGNDSKVQNSEGTGTRLQSSLLEWITLAVTGCASCLFSGMGIAISILMISVYGIYAVIITKAWKMIPLWIVSVGIPIIYGYGYYMLKG